jgi:hypothetical protein
MWSRRPFEANIQDKLVVLSVTLKDDHITVVIDLPELG